MKRILFLVPVLFCLPMLSFTEEYTHAVEKEKTILQPISYARMSQRIDEAARQYEKYSPVPRIALMDYAFGISFGEYKDMNASGVLMISSQCQDKNELPLKRVYFKYENIIAELIFLYSKKYKAASPLSQKVFGKYRVDSFYLLPYAYTRVHGDIYIDWQKNRKDFLLIKFPDTVSLNYIKSEKDIMWAQNPKSNDAVLAHFLQREFSFTKEEAKQAIINLGKN